MRGPSQQYCASQPEQLRTTIALLVLSVVVVPALAAPPAPSVGISAAGAAAGSGTGPASNRDGANELAEQERFARLLHDFDLTADAAELAKNGMRTERDLRYIDEEVIRECSVSPFAKAKLRRLMQSLSAAAKPNLQHLPGQLAAAQPSKYVTFPLGLGRRAIMVRPGHASREWWGKVESGLWETTTFKALYQEVTADVVYVGIGEWCGVTGLFAAQRSARKAILVEPDPHILEELRTNVESFKAGSSAEGHAEAKLIIDTRCIVPSAMSNTKVTMRGNGSSISSFIPLPVLSDAPSFEASCLSLESLYDYHHLSGRVFIKMDIEGAEAFVIPELLSWLKTLESKPSFLVSFHGVATPDQKEKIARVLNLYDHFAILRGHSTGFEDGEAADDCKMGVPLTDNSGSAFKAENLCEKCDILITSSRARSDILCSGKMMHIHKASAKTRKTATERARTMEGKRADGVPSAPNNRRAAGNGQSRLQRATVRSHDDGRGKEHRQTMRSMSEGDLAQTISAMETRYDAHEARLAALEEQNDWQEIATNYVSCSISLSLDEIVEALDAQRRNPSARQTISMGGLGRKMIKDRYEVWVCKRGDRCATEDDFMCYVYDEKDRVFLPWAPNSDLNLVKAGPFMSVRESTAGLALAETRLLRQEVAEHEAQVCDETLDEFKALLGTAPLSLQSGTQARTFTRERNISSILWRETAEVRFVPDAVSTATCELEWPYTCYIDRTVTFSHALAVDKGRSTCFETTRDAAGMQSVQSLSFGTLLRLTAVQTQYAGRKGDNELQFSSPTPDFCFGNSIRVSNLQFQPDRFQISTYNNGALSPFVPSSPSYPGSIGAGYQPLAITLANGRGTLFVNFHAGQNYGFELNQKRLILWRGDFKAGYSSWFRGHTETQYRLKVTDPADTMRYYTDTSLHDLSDWCRSLDLCRGDFEAIPAGPLVQRYPVGTGSMQPFGRVLVGVAQNEGMVWFAGGLEVTGDGPQGTDIATNRAGARPSLRALQDILILNVDDLTWASAKLSSARFGVSGGTVAGLIFFAGGAQLGRQMDGMVVDHFQWQTDVSSCGQECGYVYSFICDSYNGCGYSDVYSCRNTGCQAVPIQKAAVNSDVVEVFDSQDFGLVNVTVAVTLVSTSDIKQPGSEIIIAGLAPGASLTPTGEIALNPPESSSYIMSGHQKFKTANGNVGRADWNRQDGTLTLTVAYDGLPQHYTNRYAFSFDLQFPAEARQDTLAIGSTWTVTAKPVQSLTAVPAPAIVSPSFGLELPVREQHALSQARRFAAGASITTLNLVLFAGGVTSSNETMPAGGWLSSQTSSAVDIFTVTDKIEQTTHSLSAPGMMVAGSTESLVVLLYHHENEEFNNAAHVFDGSVWTTSSHPGNCGVQHSSASTTRHIIFLSACEPEALLFDVSSRTWSQLKFDHSLEPARVISVNEDNEIFIAGQAGNGNTTEHGIETSALFPTSQCGWDGLGSWRTAACGDAATIYTLPPGFVTASVEISSVANPDLFIQRMVALPAYIPEIDASLSLTGTFNTTHLQTDSWNISCHARVNGRSTYSLRLPDAAYGVQPEVCITPHDLTDDEFILYGLYQPLP